MAVSEWKSGSFPVLASRLEVDAYNNKKRHSLFTMWFHTVVAAFACWLLFSPVTSAVSLPGYVEQLIKKQVPADPTGVKTITSPNNVTIRYKKPGEDGVCETTPGVNSYSGYVDLDADTHMFFWFFEARNNPNEAPLTLWLNGGPGSDALIGLFQGTCAAQMTFCSCLTKF